MKLFNQQTLWKLFSDSPNEEVQKRLLYHLYEKTQESLSAMLMLIAIFFLFLKEYIPGLLFYTWLIPIVTLTFYRLYNGYRYLHHDYSPAYQQWYTNFTYQAYATALLWGSIIFFIPYTQDHYHHMMFYLLIVGIGSGAVISFSPAIHIPAIYNLILFAPMFFHFLFMGTKVGYTLAFLVIVYYFTLYRIFKNAGQAIITFYEQTEKDKIIQNALYEKQDELNSLFKNAPIGVFYFDHDLKILDYNEAFTKLYDTDTASLVGLDLRKLPDQRPLEAIKNTLTKGVQFYNGPYTTVKGVDVWLEAKSSPIINSKGEITGGIVLVENKTAEKEALDELNYIARHDELTSLTNRRSFTEYMSSLVTHEKHYNHYSILFYLDLNQFKTINDSMGHSIGDKLLIQVANRLQKLPEENYKLSRLGGDEFVILFPFIATNREDALIKADKCSSNLRNVFKASFLIDELHLYVKSSIGIVIIEPQANSIEEIIRYADISMYSAKRKGGDTIAYYNAKLDMKRKELFSLQHDLYKAIENNQLELYYQPIVTISNDTLKAAEALVRWHHPTLGILTPEKFIPLAKESGLIDDIGWLVIDIVCRQINEWKDEPLFLLDYISVNIDAVQFQRSDFVEKFFGILDRYDVEASDIKLEITESSLIDNFEQTQEIIQRLRSRGIRCAIDDFGTGYSSLSYLKKFSFSLLKIDREFIKDILDESENTFLVESIISIGKKLGYRIVIEGIETEEQKNLLKGIDNTLRYQGFLFSVPLPAEQFQKKFL